jgi:hypothetical protein
MSFITSPAIPPFALYADDLAYGTGTSASGAIFIVGKEIQAPVKITGMKCRMGATAAGNIDMGIYDVNFNLLASKGATAAVPNSVNTLTFASPLLLSPGRYWLAWIDTAGATDTVSLAAVGVASFAVVQRSVAATFTQIAANASWQATATRISLLAVVSGGYP